jgi:hypothetical protein
VAPTGTTTPEDPGVTTRKASALAGCARGGELGGDAVPVDLSGQWLVVVSGWTGAGKSTMAEQLGRDLVAREEPIREWHELAAEHGATFAVVECVCSDADVHRARVDGRERRIPGWYELEWDQVERGRERYEPLPEPKIVIDAIASVDDNLDRVRQHLSECNRSASP